jgi:hypothetical protein
MIGESTMNKYKAYKNLVKHKRRINRVFSEVCAENSLCSHRPGIDKKAPAVVVASCSAVPPKAPRRRSSKKGKNNTYETSSSVVRPEKMKSLESSKWRRKTSKAISDVEIQAASGLAQLGQKNIKTAVKKIVATEVRRVPFTFDDDMIVEPSPKGFSSCLWRNLIFNVRSRCTPGSENEFVDVESFSDDVIEVQKEVTKSVVATDAGGVAPHPSPPQDEASLEFTKELDKTVQRGENPVENFPLIETCEDPYPSIVSFNKALVLSSGVIASVPKIKRKGVKLVALDTVVL